MISEYILYNFWKIYWLTEKYNNICEKFTQIFEEYILTFLDMPSSHSHECQRMAIQGSRNGLHPC